MQSIPESPPFNTGDLVRINDCTGQKVLMSVTKCVKPGDQWIVYSSCLDTDFHISGPVCNFTPVSPPYAIGEPVTHIRPDGVRIVALNVLRCTWLGDRWRVYATDHSGLKTFTGPVNAFESMIGHEILERVTDGVMRDIERGV